MGQTIEINAPYGNFTYRVSESEKLIESSLAQLRYFQKQGNDTEMLKRDILGYEQILNSSMPRENANNFLIVKHKALLAFNKFEDNLAIIEHLKQTNQWED